jgi:ornithine carbamoyltransferase
VSSVATSTRSLLALGDVDDAGYEFLVDTAVRYGRDPSRFHNTLSDSRVGLIFTVPSTRTRSTFWSACTTLGCHVLQLGPGDLQTSTGETWSDTGAMLANVVDAAAVRTNGARDDLQAFAQHLPTINALTYDDHPTQAIADLCALHEHFGPDHPVRIAYLGNINNTARSLMQMVARQPGYTIAVYSPAGHGFSAAEIDAVNDRAGRTAVEQFDHVPDRPDHADAVYTTRWTSMASTTDDADFLRRCEPFRIDRTVLAKFSGEREAMVMHDLPAVRDMEIVSELLDGTNSLVARQALHKASAAAAALMWVLDAKEGAAWPL